MSSRRMHLLPALTVALTSSLLIATAAHADIAPPADPCDGKAAGAACDYNGGPGICAVQQCGRLDYSNGSPPSTVDYDCNKCAAAPTPTTPTTPATPATPATTTPIAAPTPAPAPAPKAGLGCAIAGNDASLSLLMLVFLGGYRRSRRSAPFTPATRPC